MSSNLPQVRRSTRAVGGRAGAAADENASRLTRPLRSSKMATATSTRLANTNPPEKPATVPSNSLLSARADLAAAKRKREALGEVTNKNKSKLNAGAAGGSKPGVTIQGTEKETLVKRPASTTLNATTTAKAAITERSKVVATRKTRSSTAADKDEAPHDDHAMVVDNEHPSGATRTRRPSAPRTALSSTIISRRATASTSASAHASRRANVPAVSASTAASRARASGASHRVLGPTQARSNRQSSQPTEEELKPVHKKRRTSSIGPENQIVDDGEEEAQFAVPEADKAHQEQMVPGADEPELGLSSLEGEVKWEDLDKEEQGDPNMVSEYVGEIFTYLLDLELRTMPNPRYMDMQKELAWRMRGILTDWLIQIHSRFRLLPETLFLCINIIDRFLSARVVSLVKLQLVGVTSLFIAAKYEEIMAPSVANFLSSADGNYDEKDILEAEKYILRTLDWNLSYPNPIQFLRRASKADDYDLASRTVAKYLIEISCIDHRLLEAPPSLVAAAGIWLARLVLDKEEWTPVLAHYSYYSEKEILPVARMMLNYLLKPTRHENFFKKYAGRKFMKASPFVHAWARDRWPEGTNVDLEAELPELRRAAEERRLNGTAAGWLADEDGTPLVLQ